MTVRRAALPVLLALSVLAIGCGGGGRGLHHRFDLSLQYGCPGPARRPSSRNGVQGRAGAAPLLIGLGRQGHPRFCDRRRNLRNQGRR